MINLWYEFKSNTILKNRGRTIFFSSLIKWIKKTYMKSGMIFVGWIKEVIPHNGNGLLWFPISLKSPCNTCHSVPVFKRVVKGKEDRRTSAGVYGWTVGGFCRYLKSMSYWKIKYMLFILPVSCSLKKRFKYVIHIIFASL